MREGLHKIVSLDDTIVAVSTALGRSAIGVVRVSGKDTLRIVERLFRSDKALEQRRAVLGKWLDETFQALDEVVVTAYLAPHSYTGEDLVEISGHGNPYMLEQIVQAVRGKALIDVRIQRDTIAHKRTPYPHYPHAECVSHLGDFASNTAKSNDTQRLACQFTSAQAIPAGTFCPDMAVLQTQLP